MNYRVVSLCRGFLVGHLGTTGYGVLASPEHPLCVFLENNGQHQVLGRFPAKFICHHGTKEQFGCWRSDNVVNLGSEVADASPIGSSGHIFVETEHSERTTWWICEGDRQKREVQGSVSVECEGHFAFRAGVDDALPDCGQPFQTESGELSETIPSARDDFPRTAAPNKSLAGQTHRTTPTDQSATRSSRALMPKTDQFMRDDEDQACDERWTSWPAMHESALAGDNVLVYQIFPAVGNLFLTLTEMVQVSLLLEIALVLDFKAFPGFRVAFDPAEIRWDVNPEPFMEKAIDISRGVESLGESSGLHAFKFMDGVLMLSDSRLLLMALKLSIFEESVTETAAAVRRAGFKWVRALVSIVIEDAALPDPCAWNILLRRSSAMMASVAAHDPWVKMGESPWDGHHPPMYVAWHIRTSEGESATSFNKNVHNYVFHQESSTTVVPLYLAATRSAKHICPMAFRDLEDDLPIYISSNSKGMANNCSITATGRGVLPGFLDLGISAEDAHTEFSKHPTVTAMNAFLDFLYMMDADVVIRTRSSFSGAVSTIKGMKCHRGFQDGQAIPVSAIHMCIPSSGCHKYWK